ncbi:glutathione S-transferase theta-1-like [Adelges cooleyi]|uniref:glutathione S-transferase theta-1-like n=1 Tax=Adelges cooleyi TaxID=133065 RepID=UPI00217FD973|nr:glutathione S-transferase theta-1-like [Adelges cooleyi]
MTKLKFYYDLLSQPSRALFMFLKKNNIPFEPKPIHLLKGEHFSPEFESINPFQKLPVIDDGGFILIESVAILRYLCRTHNVANHWYPKDLKQQARVDEYLEWQHLNTRAHCALYVFQKIFVPIITQKPPNETELTKLEKNVTTTLNLLNNVWLKDKQYLCGNEISIADILAICEIEQTRIAGVDPYFERPILSSWKARVETFLNPFYDEANMAIEKMADKYKNTKNIKSNL